MTAAMSGPWHYREAEKLLDAAGVEEDPLWHSARAAAAQAHATLALAAATAATIPDTDVVPDATGWLRSGVLLPEPEDCDAS